MVSRVTHGRLETRRQSSTALSGALIEGVSNPAIAPVFMGS